MAARLVLRRAARAGQGASLWATPRSVLCSRQYFSTARAATATLGHVHHSAVPGKVGTALALAAVAMVAGGCVAADEHVDLQGMRKDPTTGVLLPRTLDGGYELVGLGVRALTIFQISTYVVGLYVPAGEGTTEKLIALQQASGGVNTADFLAGYTSSSELKTAFLMQTTKATRSGHLRDAVGRMLEGRVPSSLSAQDTEAVKAAIADFKRCFPKLDIPAGDEIFIEVGRGTLTVHYKGQVMGAVQSALLCEVFLGAYLGPTAVSPMAKASFLEGLEARLSN